MLIASCAVLLRLFAVYILATSVLQRTLKEREGSVGGDESWVGVWVLLFKCWVQAGCVCSFSFLLNSRAGL